MRAANAKENLDWEVSSKMFSSTIDKTFYPNRDNKTIFVELAEKYQAMLG